MELFPAIDILDNKVVRLLRGDYNSVTVYNENPVEQAKIFADAGAQWVHIVDLEGSRSGVPTQLAMIESIISETGLKAEVGGGVRCLLHISRLVEVGASRVVLGTGLVKDPAFSYEAIKRYGDLICAGVDALDGEAAVEGWQKGSGYLADQVIRHLKDRGLRHLVYTDISRDGAQTGIDEEAYRTIAGYAGFPVTASGGITTLDDIRALAELGSSVVEAAIAGRAIYENNFTVEQALAVIAESEIC
jgi:phosphoribosylformimino-5-aminoimidazole carboxamide ribotide isomerase